MRSIKIYFISIMLGIGVVSSQQNSYQVYGFITDSTSGEALIGANVFIRETGQGMATDNNGYYVLSGIQSEVVELYHMLATSNITNL